MSGATTTPGTDWRARPSGLVVPPGLAQRAPRATASAALSGRPTYLSAVQVDQPLAPVVDFRLLAMMYQTVPVLRRAVGELAGLVGAPRLVTGSERQDATLNAWAESVPVGRIGRGWDVWLRDHLAQALLFGYAVGEAEISRGRNGVAALWSYHSAAMQFKALAGGEIVIEQQGTLGLGRRLDPLRVVSTTYDPLGCDPRGQPLFLACPTAAQLWADILASYRSTWRRIGIPIFHVNWEPPEAFDDPQGTVAEQVRGALEEGWSAAMKSQAVDGLAKDFFTTGAINVEPVGAKTELVGLEEPKRAIVEELVVATGLPAWLLGYTWSTTERLSQQQADMLVSFVHKLRRTVEGSLLRMAELHLRLTGAAAPLALEWPAVTLQDATDQAKARYDDARADVERERYAAQLWRSGVWAQEQYAEFLTGVPEVATPLDAPPAAPAPATGQGQGEGRTEREYAGWRSACGHGERAGADDPVQLFPAEEPRYPQMAAEVERAWAATTEAYGELRVGMFAAVALLDPAKRDLSVSERAALDAAINAFLRRFAGEDRSEAGFVGGESEDGILQQASVLAYSVGTGRAARLTDAETPRATLTEAVRERLLREAFARMTRDGRFRFEARLLEIKASLVAGLRRGDNPLEVARRLGADLDGYHRGRLRTIVRTEMALAGESGLRDELQAQGVRQVEVIGDPETDARCTEHIGRRYAVTDESRLPIYHPNCFCSVIPVVE